MNIKVIHREAGMEDLVATSPPPLPSHDCCDAFI